MISYCYSDVFTGVAESILAHSAAVPAAQCRDQRVNRPRCRGKCSADPAAAAERERDGDIGH